MNLNEHRIREYAYYLWEAEGKPQGQATKHWEIACKLAEAEDQGPSSAPGALLGQSDTPNGESNKAKRGKNGNGSSKKAAQADGAAKSASRKTKAKDQAPAQLAAAEETFGQTHASFTTDSLVTAKSDGEFPEELKKPETRKARKSRKPSA